MENSAEFRVCISNEYVLSDVQSFCMHCVEQDIILAWVLYIHFHRMLCIQDDVIPRMNTAALTRLRNEILVTNWYVSLVILGACEI